MKFRLIFYLRLSLLASVTGLAPAQSPKYVISTLVGAPLATTPVPALSVAIGSPQGIATDAVGNVYFTTTGAEVGGNQNALLKLDQTDLLRNREVCLYEHKHSYQKVIEIILLVRECLKNIV